MQHISPGSRETAPFVKDPRLYFAKNILHSLLFIRAAYLSWLPSTILRWKQHWTSRSRIKFVRTAIVRLFACILSSNLPQRNVYIVESPALHPVTAVWLMWRIVQHSFLHIVDGVLSTVHQQFDAFSVPTHALAGCLPVVTQLSLIIT